MTKRSRANVASSFTIIKGSLIEESASYLAAWNDERTKSENLDAWKLDNPFGARTLTWLRDVAFVMSRRFDPGGRDRALVTLAKRQTPTEVFNPILLWHITRDEFLLRDFLVEWLFPTWNAGTYQVAYPDLYDHLWTVEKRGAKTEGAWAERTLREVAQRLLQIATEFGLLAGKQKKTFASYHLPEPAFMYLLYAIREEHPNPKKVIQAKDWRMYLMRPDDVERELLRLHQFRKLTYETAGSIIELGLPQASARAFAEEYAA